MNRLSVVFLSIFYFFFLVPFNAPAGETIFTLNNFIKRVKEKNETIMAQKMDWYISEEAVKSAESIFEPQFMVSGKREKIVQKFTAEETSKSIFSGVTSQNEKNDSYEIAIEGLVKTGGTIRFSNSLEILASEYNKSTGDEYETFIGASIIHPLLKNAGVDVTMANIRVSEMNKYIQFQTYRQAMMTTVFEAATAYWNLRLNQDKLRIRELSVDIAQKLVEDNKEAVKAGRIAETEVLEAQLGLMERKSVALEALQAVEASMNILKNYISTTDLNYIDAADEPILETVDLDFNESVEKAFNYFAEYLSALKTVDKEEIMVNFTQNQKKPNLDVTASYGYSGLETEVGDAYDEAFSADNYAWAIGLEFSMPIFGGKKFKSEYAAAKFRKAQARHRLKAIRIAVMNYVDTAIKSVQNTRNRARLYKATKEKNDQLLRIEMARFELGKSDSRLLLTREEDLNLAWEAELESAVNYQKALLELELAEGTLLLNHDVDVEETDLAYAEN